MKLILKIKLLITLSTLTIACSSDTQPSSSETDNLDFSGVYTQVDQKGRPAIDIIFNESYRGNILETRFNITIPSEMKNTFQKRFQTKLMTLNPKYTTNLLGYDAPTFSAFLATDILTVHTSSTTAFYDESNIFTGRALADDVIDVELVLIYGGAKNTENPKLNSDNLSSNDKPFLPNFPYLALPW